MHAGVGGGGIKPCGYSAANPFRAPGHLHWQAFGSGETIMPACVEATA